MHPMLFNKLMPRVEVRERQKITTFVVIMGTPLLLLLLVIFLDVSINQIIIISKDAVLTVQFNYLISSKNFLLLLCVLNLKI